MISARASSSRLLARRDHPGTLLEVPRGRDVAAGDIVDERCTESNPTSAPLAPAPGDVVEKKASYSAFSQSSRGEELERLGSPSPGRTMLEHRPARPWAPSDHACASRCPRTYPCGSTR